MTRLKIICLIAGFALGTKAVVDCLSAKRHRERIITASEIETLQEDIDNQVAELGVRTAYIAAANHGAIPIYHSTWQTLIFINDCWESMIALLELTDRVKRSSVHYNNGLQVDVMEENSAGQSESITTSLILLHERSHRISGAFMALAAEVAGKRYSRLLPESTIKLRLLDARISSLRGLFDEIGNWNSINEVTEVD